MYQCVKSFLFLINLFGTLSTLFGWFKARWLILLVILYFFLIATFWSFPPFPYSSIFWFCLFCLYSRLFLMNFNKILTVFLHLISRIFNFLVWLWLFSRFLNDISYTPLFYTNFSFWFSLGRLSLRRSFIVIGIAKCIY